MVSSRRTRIALLGWGSLLWDDQYPQFDRYHEDWKDGGPILPIEFSRISRRRHDALTLVIDPDNGAEVSTWFALSTRDNANDAICDLRCREDTTLANIGVVNVPSGFTNSRLESVAASIGAWAKTKDFGIVIWTDLASNFYHRKKIPFTPSAAFDHLNGLSDIGKRKAREYISNTRPEVVTPLRQLLLQNGWLAQTM